MQTLVPIGAFEEKAQKVLGNSGFDDMLEFLARRPRAGRIIQGYGRSALHGPGKVSVVERVSSTTTTTTPNRSSCC